MKKILVVDDEKNITDIVAYNLRKEGYEVVCAYDGEKGLELAISESPELILLDLMMPKLDGFAVCRRLRERNIQTPIIMLTARAEEIDKVLGFELGADDYGGRAVNCSPCLKWAAYALTRQAAS
jgi:two-component system response regulator VicR